MIYTIKNDLTGAIVYDPRIPEAVVTAPILHQKDNTIGSLTFTMYPSHPDYGALQKRRSIYAVHKNDAADPIWKGILINGTDDIDTVVSFYFEDFMSVLRDSMQDAFSFTGSPTDLFTQFLAAHNAQVQPWQQVQPGYVTVVDPNDYINRSSESELTTWEAIQTRLIDTLGGHLRMRYAGGVAYLDYLAGGTASLDPYLNTSTQVIELGENLKEFSRLISAAETYTACLPKGAEVEKYDGDGNAYKTRLTVEDVNDGSKYLVDEEAVELYGYRCAPIDETTWDDVTVVENLKTKGLTYLTGTAVKLKNTIRLSAIDLAHLGIASDSYGFLDYVQVYLSTHGISAIYLLTEIEIPLDDPSELAISLGDTALSLNDQFTKSSANAQRRIDSAIVDIIKADARIGEEIAAITKTFNSLVSSTSEELMSQVSQNYSSKTSLEDYKKTVSTTFTQTSEAFDLSFDTITKKVTTLDGSVSSRFENISKYIRFVDGNILLGEDGNPLILKITNERIQFLYNNVEIAYFSSGRLYVDQLEAITSLTLGQFAFRPDTSGGMALKYIGT